MTVTNSRLRNAALCAAASVTLCAVCAARSYAAVQGDSARSDTAAARRAVDQPVMASVGFFVLGSALSVYTHETGHWLFAYVAGANHASIRLVPPTTRMQFPQGASRVRRSIPVLAGPLTTRVVAEGIDQYLNATRPSRVTRAIGGAAYLAMRFDLPWQVIASTSEHFANDTARAHDDLGQGLVNPYFASRSSRTIVFAVLVAAETLDLWRDAGEIADNFARLRGRPPRRRAAAASGWHSTFGASPDAVSLAFRHVF